MPPPTKRGLAVTTFRKYSRGEKEYREQKAPNSIWSAIDERSPGDPSVSSFRSVRFSTLYGDCNLRNEVVSKAKGLRTNALLVLLFPGSTDLFEPSSVYRSYYSCIRLNKACI